MVKKSVDITQEDEQWLQDSYVNFSKFCRRKLAERRAEDLRSHVKQRLHEQIQGMAEKGSELRDKWDEEKEELKEEYNAEIVEQQPEYFVFEIEGDRFAGNWHPDAVFEDYDLYRLKRPITLGLALYDSRKIALGAFNERGRGQHTAMLLSTNQNLVEWGHQVYESLLEEAVMTERPSIGG